MARKAIQTNTRFDGFTFVEVVAATALLAILIATVLVLMDRFVGAVMDMRLRQQAFQLARSHMETLLSETRLSDIHDYGESETNPDILWQTDVEPFYTPAKGRMWIRAVCSASFIDSKDEEQTVELEHWITNLTAEQIRQILAQQEAEAAYMDLLQPGQYTDMQLTTIAFLEQEQLDVAAYKDLLEEHRRKKVEYLNKNSTDGYDEYVAQLEAEENEFLTKLGMDFDKYNEFAQNYVPPESDSSPDFEDPTDPADPSDPTDPDPMDPAEEAPPQFDWDKIDPSLWPLIEKLTGAKPPSR